MNRLAVLAWQNVVAFSHYDTKLCFSQCSRLAHQIVSDAATQQIRTDFPVIQGIFKVVDDSMKTNRNKKEEEDEDDEEEASLSRISSSSDSDDDNDQHQQQMELLLLREINKNAATHHLVLKFLLAVSSCARQVPPSMIDPHVLTRFRTLRASRPFILSPSLHVSPASLLFFRFSEHFRSVFETAPSRNPDTRDQKSTVDIPGFGLSVVQPTWPHLVAADQQKSKLRLVYHRRELFESSLSASGGKKNNLLCELEAVGGMIGVGVASIVAENCEKSGVAGQQDFCSFNVFVECGSGGCVQLCIFVLFSKQKKLAQHVDFSVSSTQDDEILACRRGAASDAADLVISAQQRLLTSFRELLPPAAAEGSAQQQHHDPTDHGQVFEVAGERLGSLEKYLAQQPACESSSFSPPPNDVIEKLKTLTGVVQHLPQTAPTAERANILFNFISRNYFDVARERIRDHLVARGIKTVTGRQELVRALTTPKGIYSVNTGTFNVRLGQPVEYLEHTATMFENFLRRNQSRIEFLLGGVLPIGALCALQHFI